jgi:hypothetical protein
MVSNLWATASRPKLELGEQYLDALGVPFGEIRLHLPDRVADWPRVVRVHDPAIVKHYRQRSRCDLCRDRGTYFNPIEAHHLTGGSRGRSDEACNLTSLCRRCHKAIQSLRGEFSRVWRAKWQHDPTGTDWVRLVLLLGRWPDFDTLGE